MYVLTSVKCDFFMDVLAKMLSFKRMVIELKQQKVCFFR